MAETWNKRQRQRKKQQMKKEKAEKRMMRKEQGTASFESMIAYVDEDGNLTTEKPQPAKRDVKADTKLYTQNQLRLKNMGY